MKCQNVQISQISAVSVKNKAGDRSPKRTLADIQSWIVSYLADLLEIHVNEIDTTIPFDRYGLDSVVTVSLIGDLAEWLGYELEPTLAYDYPTVEALVRHLEADLQQRF
jgi:acyl carrier protein